MIGERASQAVLGILIMGAVVTISEFQALANESPGELGALLEVMSFIPLPVWIILGVLVAALMAAAFLFSRK